MTTSDPAGTSEIGNGLKGNGENQKGSVKTLALRLKPDTHAQLSLIAQLRGSTITDEIRQAIDAHIHSVGASPDFAAQAEQVLADIDRQASARRDAIASLFGNQSTSSNGAKPSPTAPRGRTRSAGKTS